MASLLSFAFGVLLVLGPMIILWVMAGHDTSRRNARLIAGIVALALIASLLLITVLGLAVVWGVGVGLLLLLLFAGRQVTEAASHGKVGDPLSPEEARRVLRGIGGEEDIDALLDAERTRQRQHQDDV